MKNVDWLKVKARLKKAVDQGVKVLKEGGEGMSFVAGQTAHVIQLEFEVHQLKSRIAALFQKLGEVIYRSKNGKAGDQAREIQRDLDLLHASLKKKQAEIKNTHLTEPIKRKSKKR